MIAYKIFSRLPNGKLGPITIDNLEYDPKYIMTRPDGYGPFACFKNLKSVKDFGGYGSWECLYKIKVKSSKETKLWYPHNIYGEIQVPLYLTPKGTILADEFEILEEIK